jgi:hypothetical protein
MTTSSGHEPCRHRGTGSAHGDVDRESSSLVSLYFVIMSRPVWRMVSMTVSNDTRYVPSRCSARRAANTAIDDETALRSMQGTCTSPPAGSQVRPRWCSIAISAAFSTWRGVPPSAAQRAPDAIAQAVPTSAWHPPSTPEIDAFALTSEPFEAAGGRPRT